MRAAGARSARTARTQLRRSRIQQVGCVCRLRASLRAPATVGRHSFAARTVLRSGAHQARIRRASGAHSGHVARTAHSAHSAHSAPLDCARAHSESCVPYFASCASRALLAHRKSGAARQRTNLCKATGPSPKAPWAHNTRLVRLAQRCANCAPLRRRLNLHLSPNSRAPLDAARAQRPRPRCHFCAIINKLVAKINKNR